MSELTSKEQRTWPCSAGHGFLLESCSDCRWLEIERLRRELATWQRNCTGNHGSQMQCAASAHEPRIEQRPLSASQRLHNICDALSEHADESPFTREEWESLDKQTVEQQNRIRELEAEVSTLRDHLAEVNRLMSLNCREVERLRSTQPPGERLRYAAADACLDIFNDMVQSEAKTFPRSIQIAWETGSAINQARTTATKEVRHD